MIRTNQLLNSLSPAVKFTTPRVSRAKPGPPAWSPNLNAFAEDLWGPPSPGAWNGSWPSARGTRVAVRAFVKHYHEERPHQGLGNELITPRPVDRHRLGHVRCGASAACSKEIGYSTFASVGHRG